VLRRVVAERAGLRACSAADLPMPMLLRGIAINTSPTDYRPPKQMRLVQFDGKTWQPFSDIIADEM